MTIKLTEQTATKRNQSISHQSWLKQRFNLSSSCVVQYTIIERNDIVHRKNRFWLQCKHCKPPLRNEHSSIRSSRWSLRGGVGCKDGVIHTITTPRQYGTQCPTFLVPFASRVLVVTLQKRLPPCRQYEPSPRQLFSLQLCHGHDGSVSKHVCYAESITAFAARTETQ